MCNYCGKDLKIIEYRITDKTDTITMCPNCLCLYLCLRFMWITIFNCSTICERSKKKRCNDSRDI